ncbi:hypothetical protein NOF04DRAFT_14345 [Fusarium oxysporum II5]|uniref:Uncharacterized protein n=2 Tax=Fusarium oxysporum species complex TaxID=171631 RepID=X0K7F3_FUSO5|nr:uncharacterized protein FOIG_14118 [Fusarium odoratissimum NRRL 54006]EXL92949.1 hypothetical protein FOIG_14118 [Fusarium odoratissimum NRRL 54006]KAK2123166.1 hypothetical protein NOF04DRAFT_14345 [Fusarium oxysporum II5]TXB97633.1 hypothetical protein FocTR4_00011750 [Fusarium oxysporum f. sp. cubense]
MSATNNQVPTTQPKEQRQRRQNTIMCKIRDVTYVRSCKTPETKHEVEESGEGKGSPKTCPLRYYSLKVVTEDCEACVAKKKEAAKAAKKA